MSDPKASVDEQVVLDSSLEQSATEKEQSQAAADYQAHQNGGPPSMQVKVYSPFNDYYDGPAFSISAENTTGPFDVLPKHHNFITLLSPCEMIVRTLNNGDQKISISGGIMHVKADQVIVFLDV